MSRAWGAYKDERPPADAELAVYVASRYVIVTEHGETIDASTSADIDAWLRSGKRILLVNDLAMWAPLPVFLADTKHCEAPCDEHGVTKFLRVTGAGRRVSLVIAPRSSWGLPADRATMKKLRSLFDTMGVGAIAFPGAMGSAYMRRRYQGKLLWNPSEYDRDLFRRHLIGGRSITPEHRIGSHHKEVWYQDENASFLHILRIVPAGKPIAHHGPRPDDWGDAPSYHHITWEATGESPYGCLPVRGSDGEPIYPCVGKYDGWYWDHEITDAQENGVTVVEWHEARMFDGWDYGFGDFVDDAMALKQATKGTPIEALVKMVLLAGIGAFASQEDGHRLLIDKEGTSGGRLIGSAAGGLDDPYVILDTRRERAGAQPHLTSYVFARSRVQILVLSRLAGAHLIASDYDAIVTDVYLALATLGDRDGEWKVKLLKEYTCYAPRSAIAEGHIRLPGQTGKKRQTLLQEWKESIG